MQNETHPRFNDLLKIWWAMTWRTLLMFPVIFCLSFAYGMMIIDESELVLYLIAPLFAILIFILWNIYILKWVLNKDYGTFKLKVYDYNGNEKEVNFKVKISFWWAYVWRTTLVAIPVTLVDIAIAATKILPLTLFSGLFCIIFRFYIGVSFIKYAINKNYQDFRISFQK